MSKTKNKRDEDTFSKKKKKAAKVNRKKKREQNVDWEAYDPDDDSFPR